MFYSVLQLCIRSHPPGWSLDGQACETPHVSWQHCSLAYRGCAVLSLCPSAPALLVWGGYVCTVLPRGSPISAKMRELWCQQQFSGVSIALLRGLFAQLRSYHTAIQVEVLGGLQHSPLPKLKFSSVPPLQTVYFSIKVIFKQQEQN